MALAKLSACACGGALIGGGAVHVAERPSRPVHAVRTVAKRAAPKRVAAVRHPARPGLRKATLADHACDSLPLRQVDYATQPTGGSFYAADPITGSGGGGQHSVYGSTGGGFYGGGGGGGFGTPFTPGGTTATFTRTDSDPATGSNRELPAPAPSATPPAPSATPPVGDPTPSPGPAPTPSVTPPPPTTPPGSTPPPATPPTVPTPPSDSPPLPNNPPSAPPPTGTSEGPPAPVPAPPVMLLFGASAAALVARWRFTRPKD